MANLVATTISGSLSVGGSLLPGTTSDQTPWYRISYTGTSSAYRHIRTPLPADTSYLGWNPSILEVYGFLGYSGDKTYDFKALVNVNGYDNQWYGSQIPMNDSYSATPTVYRSTSTYGGVTRVCFSIPESLANEPAYLFIRWWNNMAAWNNYAWANTTSASTTGAY